MPIADRRASTLTTIAAAAVAVAVALAYGTALPVRQPTASRPANHVAADPLTGFLQRWTNTAEVNHERQH